LRDESDRTTRARRFADAIDACAAAAEHDLTEASRILEAEAIAWLVLCDRGWPNDVRADSRTLGSAREWMAAWSEYVALPPKLTASRDAALSREIRGMLETAERTLKDSLPAPVWALVDPLDATGRATLASLLQSLATWSVAHSLALIVAERTVHVRERFERLTREAQALGLSTPPDPLDVGMWRVLAAQVRTTSV
jgi:hypothetical protein